MQVKLAEIKSSEYLFFKLGRKEGGLHFFFFSMIYFYTGKETTANRTEALWAPSEVKLPFMPFAQKTVLKQLEQMVGTPLSVYLYPQR